MRRYFLNLWDALLGRPGYVTGLNVGFHCGLQMGYLQAAWQHDEVHRRTELEKLMREQPEEE